MPLWLQDCLPRSWHFPAESAECKPHSALRGISRHCSRRLLPGTTAPSPLNYLAARPRAFDNIHRAAYCIPSMHSFVDSEAVRRSIHEPEDEHRDTQDFADLLPRGASLFVAWQEWSASRSASNPLKTLKNRESQAISGEPLPPFRQSGDQIDPTCAEPPAQDPLQA